MSAKGESIGLPVRTFFFTLDQVAGLIQVDEKYLKNNLLHYEGRHVGPVRRDKIKAINIAPDGDQPIWRIPERDLTRWLRFKGLKYYERGYLQ